MKTRFGRWGWLRGWFCLLMTVVLLAGCHSGGTEVGNPGAGTLELGFADERALENYVKDQFAGAVVDLSAVTDLAGGAPATGDVAAPEAGAGEGVRDYSGTNVQEAGVDESDKVKTDGNYLYVAQQGGVRIVRLAANGAMSAVARVSTDGPVDSLYHYRSLLVVLYHPLDAEGDDWCAMVGAPEPFIGAPAVMPCWIPVGARTGVLIVNVQDPANPVRISDRVFDGSLISSRRIGGKLHLVSRFMPDLPPLEYYYDGGNETKSSVVQRNRQALQGLSLDDLIPAIESRDAAGNPIASGRLAGPENFLRPSYPQGGSVVTLTTFDLDNPAAESIGSISAILNARHVYASTTALYLAAEAWANDASGQAQTLLHKFDLSGGTAAYAASGSVPGTVLNQFSLGEYQDVLRVATSTWSWWGDSGQGNHVYCLRQNEGDLEIVGRLENLAPGERLYAARFMAEKGFLVTFVQVDPLFTLDLSDPADPKLVGELKVPGYSDYIHPLGADHLLTIGKNAIVADGGGTFLQGLQLSIFDVSDFANPTLSYRLEIGDRGTESQALHDHKAFSYWAEQGLLAIPVDLYEHLTVPQSPWEYGQPTFSGLYVYRIDPATGFDFQGRIDSSASAAPGFYYPLWARGLFVADAVYSVSAPAVSSAQLAAIETTVTVLDIR
ncbi:MAG TPA: beta-propeller domain-containing protein [Geopsychrobacteraceae bacterium]